MVRGKFKRSDDKVRLDRLPPVRRPFSRRARHTVAKPETSLTSPPQPTQSAAHKSTRILGDSVTPGAWVVGVIAIAVLLFFCVVFLTTRSSTQSSSEPESRAITSGTTAEDPEETSAEGNWFRPETRSAETTAELVESELELPPAEATDVRESFTRLSDEVPEGDYGVDSALVTHLGSFIDFGSSGNREPARLTLYIGFETDAVSIDDVLDRVLASTFTGETELDLNDWFGAKRPNWTSNIAQFESPGGSSKLKFIIREYNAAPGIARVGVEYSYRVNDDVAKQYLDQWSGWTAAYPGIEDGYTNSIGYVVRRKSVVDSKDESFEGDANATYVELWLSHELPDTDAARGKDETSGQLYEDLEVAGWVDLTLESVTEGTIDKLTGIAPSGTAYTMNVDDAAPSRIEFFYRSDRQPQA